MIATTETKLRPHHDTGDNSEESETIRTALGVTQYSDLYLWVLQARVVGSSRTSALPEYSKVSEPHVIANQSHPIFSFRATGYFAC